MWFKHLHLFRLHDASAFALEALASAMAEHAFRPLGSVEARRLGWAAPAGRGSEQRVHEINGQRLLSALRQERLLPASVVREEVEARAADREAAEGRPLRRVEKQALKEQVYEEFLPQAFVRTQRIDLWWDTRRHLIGINASSRKRAEEVLDLLRQTLGSLKVTPLSTKVTPVNVMTQWLTHPETRPGWLTLGDQTVLMAGAGDDGAFTARRVDLDGEEVRNILDSGRYATRMAITLEGQLSLVLNDDLSLKSMKFDDELLDEASQADDNGSKVLRVETDFALMSSTLADVVERLIDALGGEATPAMPQP